MTKVRFLAAAAAAAVLSACGMGASYPKFEEASYRIEGMTADPSGGAPTQTVIYRDGPKMRVEAALPQYGEAVVVFDQATNAAYVLTQPTTGPALAPAPSATATIPPATTIGETAASSTVAPPTTTAPAPAVQSAGVAIRLADADAPQPIEAAWAALGGENARRVGDCDVAGESGTEWAPKETPAGAERTACITNDGIVLRVRENNVVLWEATSLQRGQQDAALFGVPANYQLVDPAAVARGVGERMEQLDSVTGNAAPATTAPAPSDGT